MIILGLKGLKIEEHAQEIQTLLVGLARDLKDFQEDFRLVGKHISDAKNRFDEVKDVVSERFGLNWSRSKTNPRCYL